VYSSRKRRDLYIFSCFWGLNSCLTTLHYTNQSHKRTNGSFRLKCLSPLPDFNQKHNTSQNFSNTNARFQANRSSECPIVSGGRTKIWMGVTWLAVAIRFTIASTLTSYWIRTQNSVLRQFETVWYMILKLLRFCIKTYTYTLCSVSDSQQLIECNYPCYSRDISLERHLYLIMFWEISERNYPATYRFLTYFYGF
jgi:hypothetical protein